MSRVCFKKDFTVFTKKPQTDTKKQQTTSKVEQKVIKQPVQIKDVNNIFKLSNFDEEQDGQKYSSTYKSSTTKSISEYKPNNSLPVYQPPQIIKPTKQEQKQVSSTKKNKVVRKQQQGDQPKKPRKQRTKKIKKGGNQGNMVRLDMKKKYEQKYRGGLAANKKKFNRNGTLKDKYKKTGIQSQIEINGDGIYNSYVHSLSSALQVTLYLDQNDNVEEKPLVNCKQFGNSKQQLTKLINQVFGYQDFRFGQYEVVQSILQYKSTLFISQTGSGKSLTYILGSLLCTGIAVVISPLISLMLDQIQSLPKQLPGVCIHSHLSMEQKQRIIKLINDGKVKILYMTPQALQTQLAYKMRFFPPISFVCIDQAHCISELSHNFRTSYLSIHELIKANFKFEKQYCVLALTASANDQTAKSIMKKLQITQYIRSSTLNRSNLVLTASKDSGQKKYASILSFLRSQPIRKLRGILIYCKTYVKVKQVCHYLKNSGISCAMFFSQLTQKQKTIILHQFRKGQIKVITSTVALGMGLDFANLDSVIHLCMPSSVENYVQQIGRAGRRGRTAHCHLFLDQSDYLKQRGYILSQKNDRQDLNELFKSIKQNTFEKLIPQKLSLKRLLQESDSQNQIQFKHQDYKGRYCYVNCKQLSEKLDVKEQSIITILLKIQEISQGKLIKVLAPSYESLQIAMYKNNEKVIKEESQLFKHITDTSKYHNGKYFVKLIDRCNALNRIPSDLLGQIQALADQYWMRIEKKGTIFVWKYIGQITFEQFNEQYGKKLANQMKEVQDIRLLKLNILYTLMYLNSYFNIANLIEHEVVQKQHKKGIQDLIDKYFVSSSHDFYQQLTEGEHYLPIFNFEQMVYDEKSKIQKVSVEWLEAQRLAKRFLHHEGIEDKKTMHKYMNGKITTNILLGISTPAFHEKKYGQQPYFGAFKNANYDQMLKCTKEACLDYLIELETDV